MRTWSHGLYLAFSWLLAGLLLLAPAGPAEAFHFPWDQGHDTFTPDEGDDDTDPGDDEPCLFGSPFEPASGNFRWEERDLVIPSFGPPLTLTRFYNSHDLRAGIFGRGWSFTYDRRLVLTTDGSAFFGVCHSPTGRRVRFTLNSDGTFSAPKNVYDTLQRNPDGTFTLTRRNGTRFVFDAHGFFVALIDSNGNRLSLDYDETGFLTRVTDASGRALHFSKGPDGRVAAVTDPAGRQFRYFYDAEGNLREYVDPAGVSTTYSYTARNKLAQVQDGNGHVLQHVTYDSQNRVASYLEEAETWTVSYLADRTIETDSLGNAWTIRFNDDGSITHKIDPLGSTEIFDYDENLNLVGYTNKNGKSVRLTYDSSGALRSFTDPSGGQTVLGYDPVHHRLTSLTDPLGRTTSYEYDARGNLLKVTDAAGTTTSFSYDSRGQRVSHTDGLGIATLYSYGPHGDISSVRDSLGQVGTFAHDLAGRLLSATSRDGLTTRYGYDELDRLVRMESPTGAVTIYGYDPVGNVTSITDPLGRTTSYAYDSFDRVVRREDPLGAVETFGYDVKGHLVQHVDRNGATTTFSYDALSRLLEKTTGDGSVSFTYDPQGNVLSVTDADSHLSYSYDALNRVATSTDHGTSGVQPDITLVYSYDAASQLTGVADSLGGRIGYQYDGARRLVSVTAAGETVHLSYDGRGQVRRIEYPNGLTTAFATDNAGRLGVVETFTPARSSVLERLEYEYTPNDRVSKVVRNGVPQAFAYDAMSQITKVDLPGVSETYAFDAVGNRISSHRSTTHSHDAANRLLEDDSFIYSYDANGNLTRKTSKTDGSATLYIYDAENRLAEVQAPDGTVTAFQYDGWGRRIGKSVNGALTRFVHQFSDVLLELDASGAMRARYAHGDRLDQPLAMERDGELYFYHSDLLGSIRLLSDSSGTVQNSYDYDPFGHFRERVETVESPYGFTARAFDSETDLYYYRARYFSPEQGRFLTEDPIGYAGRDVNLYRYVWNDPLNHTDPSGLIPLDTLWDLGNVLYDLWVGDCEALALDLAAMAVPYLPAGVTKIDDAIRAGDKALDVASDVARRPKNFRQKTVQDAWDNAANGSKPGTKACPTCGKDVEVAPGQGPRDWDVDHQPPWSQRDHTGKTRQEVLDDYNRGTRLECPSCNRSRGAEPAGDGGG